MRLFVDEDLSPALVKECHQAGYDATCSRDRGMLSASDHKVTELWDDALDDVRRFYSEDPWGNRVELLATR